MTASTDPPYRVEVTATPAGLREEYGSLPPGVETGVEVTVAGRLMLRRDGGRLAFGELRDAGGAIQLFCGTAWTDDYDQFKKLSLGDWISATGEAGATP